MGRLLVVLGTSSGAGKSFVVTALCRWFRKKGLKVAPFKAQNMSLNAVAGVDGEMAWAQFVQALACGEVPTVRFNPVLLKPVGYAKSELIILGKSTGFVHSASFDHYRDKAKPVAYAVLRELLSEYDIVVAEGAGSPVEVNLKEKDFANISIALEFNAPALLVADIDRGGVFAQIVGTYELLEPEERRYLKGVIINKFRGYVDILKPGLDFVEKKIGVPVLAVFPYVEDVLPPEDSLDIKDKAGSPVIGVVRYPRLSNFSDITPFGIEDVGICWCSSPEEVDRADAIVLPGSRRVLDDLRWMKERGVCEAVIKAHLQGKWILGICGGYHMLLEELVDPNGTEGGGEEKGLGLIKGKVVYGREKRVERLKVKVAKEISWLRGEVEGYRIHSGEVYLYENLPYVLVNKDWADGVCKGNVLGTHLHNLFWNDEVRWNFVREIGGISSKRSYLLEMQRAFDGLAEQIEHHSRLVKFLSDLI